MTTTSSVPPRPLRIVVADDQASVREGLVLLLDLLPDFDVVGSAAKHWTRSPRLDRRHPARSAHARTRRRRHHPPARPGSSRGRHRRPHHLDPDVQAVLLNATGHAVPGGIELAELPESLPDGLTRREAGILTMIARGKTNPDIAHELMLSSHTIKSHINRIFAKTGSTDRAAAVRYAREHHLG